MAFLLDRNSKADTRLLALAGGGLAVDVSQWRANLTNHTTYHTSGDARLAPRSPREISVVVDLGSGQDGILVNWGNVAGTSYQYRIRIDSGAPTFGVNDADIGSVNPPNLSGTPKSYLIHWCVDYDLVAASYYSEIAICDIGGNVWEVQRIEHDQPQVVSGGEQFNLLGYGAGVDKFTGGLALVDAVRIGCRFHSVCEGSEDWVVESSAPSITGVSPTVELAPSSSSFFAEDPNEDVANAMLDEGTFAGPIEFASNINATAQHRRLYSPILNVVCNSPPAYSDAFFPSNMWRQSTFLALYQDLNLCLGHVYWRPCVNSHAKVRVHAQAYLEAGAPMGSIIQVKLLMWSLLQKPGLKIPQGPPGQPTSSITITDDHTDTGTGQWYDLGELALNPVDKATWLGLAIGFGNGTGHDFIRVKVKAITVEGYDTD